MNFKDYVENSNIHAKTQALETWVANNKSQLQNTKLHMSDSKKIIPHSRGQYIMPDYGRVNGKPNGFWYSLGSAWLEFLLFEYQSAIKNYIFKVETNPTKIITLQNQQQMDELNSKYCPGAENSKSWGWGSRQKRAYYPNRLDDDPNKPQSFGCVTPDWSRIARDWDGVEIPDNDKVYAMWTDDWAVPSGCVWNKRGVKSVELIAEYQNEAGYVSINKRTSLASP